MAVNSSILAKIKTTLRINHTVLDEDIGDTIGACLKDLEVCGIKAPTADDLLILNAIKLYCRAEFTDDTDKAAEYMTRYNALKSCLMMAEGYREATGDE